MRKHNLYIPLSNLTKFKMFEKLLFCCVVLKLAVFWQIFHLIHLVFENGLKSSVMMNIFSFEWLDIAN